MRPEPTLPEIKPGHPTVWLGLQLLTVLIRVSAVVVLALVLFLSVFLGYITLPLLVPILLGVGYAGLVLWRKVFRSR
jgi:hypothetical protein